MKRFLALLLVVFTVFSMSSCGKENAEKYCYNCGKGITKEISYCPDCGTLVKDTGETTTEETTPATTTEETIPATTTEAPTTIATTTITHTTTSDATTVSTTAKPIHKHSYSKKVTPASCTKKGYTTYTCSCGKSYVDDYTDPTHDYKDYKCTKCNAIDQSHAYDILLKFVKENGKKTSDNDIYFNYKNDSETVAVSICYDAEYDSLWLKSATKSDGIIETVFEIDLSSENNKFNYKLINNSYKLFGIIDGSTYKKGSLLTYNTYDGIEKARDLVVKLASQSTDALLIFLRGVLETSELGIELKDLGFSAFE